MRAVLRILVPAILLYVGAVVLFQLRTQAHMEKPNMMKIGSLFFGLVLDGGILAVVVALWVVPAVGELMGSLVYSPAQEIEPDPHSAAISALAQGDPERAIANYEAVLAKNPADTLAISEIARICCRDLDDSARGGAVLEEALGKEWTQEEGAFLGNRLADVYLEQGDPTRAGALLSSMATTMAGTKFAANALHRLHEIERMYPANLGTPPASLDENSGA